MDEIQNGGGLTAKAKQVAGIPCLTVSESGAVLRCSGAARGLLARADGLRLSERGLLTATQSSEQARLSRWIRSPSGVKSMTLSRSSPRPDLVLVQAANRPLSNAESADQLLCVVEPDFIDQDLLAAAASGFQLTKAELRLLILMLKHGGLRPLVKSGRLNRNTAKMQLSSILGKTKAGSQEELIRLFTALLYTQMGVVSGYSD